jgi:hypothetical protein
MTTQSMVSQPKSAPTSAAKKAPAKAKVPARVPAAAPLEPPQLGQGRRSAARGLVELHTYKLAETVPERAEFSRCMVRIVGFDQAQASPDLIWGVHGTTSQRAAQEYARSDAQFRRLQTFRLEISYRVPKLTGLRNSVDEQIAQELGYLHCTRIAATYRAALRVRMLDWLKDAKDPEYTRLATLKFDKLIMHRPMLIHRLMAEDSFLNIVIHPVFLNGGVTLSIATVRNDPELIQRVSAGVHEEIKVTV